MKSLTEGDSWLDQWVNVLLFCSPGGGKQSSCKCSLAFSDGKEVARLVSHVLRIWCRGCDPARRKLRLESVLGKLVDKYRLQVLNILVQVAVDSAETRMEF